MLSELDFEEDLTFPEGEGDDVEVLVAVVVSHVVSEGAMIVKSYCVNDDGWLVWMGEADRTEEEGHRTYSGVQAALPLGCGHQIKMELW
jgi:hypothetical protein